jgi:hypothetical protein
MPDEILALAMRLWTQAGDILLSHWIERDSLIVTTKRSGDFVFQADRAAEDHMRQTLARLCPGNGFLRVEKGGCIPERALLERRASGRDDKLSAEDRPLVYFHHFGGCRATSVRRGAWLAAPGTYAAHQVKGHCQVDFPPIGDKPPASSRSASATILLISPPGF